MPRVNREDSPESGTTEQPEQPASSAASAVSQGSPSTRRRRVGRRVVRGTGAAGAALELQVEEHASSAAAASEALFEEPRINDGDVSAPRRGTHGNGDDATQEDSPAPRTRRRSAARSRSQEQEDEGVRVTRRRVRGDDEGDEGEVRRSRAVRRRRDVDDADAEGRVLDAVETLSEERDSHRSANHREGINAIERRWLDVARFASMGIPAVNFGAGSPLLAHKHDEQVAEGELDLMASILMHWLG